MTALRRGKLVGLQCVDVNWPARRCASRRTTPRGVRLAQVAPGPFGADGRPARRRARAPLPALAVSRQGRPHVLPPADRSRPRRVEVAQALRSRAGARRCPPDHRHAFGTQIAAAGAQLRAMQEWLGHADASTTEIHGATPPTRPGGAIFAKHASGTGGRALSLRARRLTDARSYSSRRARTQARTSPRRRRRHRPTRIDGSVAAVGESPRMKGKDRYRQRCGQPRSARSIRSRAATMAGAREPGRSAEAPGSGATAAGACVNRCSRSRKSALRLASS